MGLQFQIAEFIKVVTNFGVVSYATAKRNKVDGGLCRSARSRKGPYRLRSVATADHFVNFARVVKALNHRLKASNNLVTRLPKLAGLPVRCSLRQIAR